MRLGLGLVVAVAAMWACTTQPGKMKTASGLVQRKFQTEIDGKPTDLFRLTNASGMEVCVTNYGGRIVSIMVPDRKGVMQDVVLGATTERPLAGMPTALPKDVLCWTRILSS